MAKTQRWTRGLSIDYTPGSEVAAGFPVEIAGIVGIPVTTLAANEKASLDMRGHFKGELTAVTVVAGDVVGWDADGDPYGGDAGTGAYTNNSSAWDFPVGRALYAGTNTSGVVYFELNAHWLAQKLGSFGAPVTMTAANARYFEAYTACSAESGSSDGFYWGHAVTGAGGSGGGGDFYGWADGVAAANIGGVKGAAYFTGGGSITGLGVGVHALLEIPDAALVGGTYCAGMSVLYAKGANSHIGGATRHAIHRFVLDGDPTGKATANTVLEFAGLTTGTGDDDMVKTDKHANASTDGIRCIVNGEVKYLMIAD